MGDQEEPIGADICPNCFCPKDKRAAVCRRCWRFGHRWWMDITPEAYDQKMMEVYGVTRDKPPS